MLSPFFQPLFEPLGALWTLMYVGMVWLFWRRFWKAAIPLAVPVFVLFMIGSTSCVDRWVERAERPYAHPVPEGPFDAIVVLGGGHYRSDNEFFGIGWSGASARGITGVELARRGLAPCLVLGGSVPEPGNPPGDHIPSTSASCSTNLILSAKVQSWVESLGLPGVTVTNLGVCRNTHDEAMACKRLCEQHGWKRICLVTSALHMRRSEALFQKQGLSVVPVACDFQSAGTVSSGFSPFPRQQRFMMLSQYLHEVLGWRAYKWRQWI